MTQRTEWIDPDPFTITMVVAAVLSTVAQFTTLGMQLSQPKKPLFPANRETNGRLLHQSLDEAADTAQRVVAFLSRVGRETNLLEREFRCGEVRLMLTVHERWEFEELLVRILNRLQITSHYVLEIVTQDEQFATEIGVDVMRVTGSISDRVNKMLRQPQTYGYVFEEAVDVLRSLSETIGRLRGARN